MEIVGLTKAFNPDPDNFPTIYWGDALHRGTAYRCIYVGDDAAFLVTDKAAPELKAAMRETFRRVLAMTALVLLLLATVSASAQEYSCSAFRPSTPINCRGEPHCACDADGHCTWVWLDCGN